MTKVLKIVKKKIKKVEVKEKFVPTEFFQDRKGLYVWNSFKNNIVDKAKESKKGFKSSISSFTLLKSATDNEIEKELPKKHLFSETEVCVVVASLIEKQSKGEDGPLKNNGYANLFYTRSHVVRVYWDGGRWGVGGWNRDDGTWGGGGRVFSPATEI